MLSLGTGLHPGIPEARYHARIPGLASKGALDKVRKSLAHYKAWLEAQESSNTAALLFGKGFHCSVLEPDVFASNYVVEPDHGDCRLKENKARRDEWRASHEGKILVSDGDARAFDGIAKALSAHKFARELIRGGVSELTLRWQDAETGLECKGRCDYYIPGLATVVDLKTTADASFDDFRKSAASYGYHRQDAFYRQGFAACGVPIDNFIFIAVEKVPPYAVAVFALDRDAVRKGSASVAEDLRTLAEGVERDEWPGYPEEIQVLDLPPWAA